MPELSSRRRRHRSGRRRDDRGYVDRYDARTWGVALSVLVLSVMDAWLTGMQIVQGKSREANPLMDWVICHAGLWTFFGLKAAMTALPLAIIVLHKEWLMARYAARLCLWCYVGVSVYHLYLVLIV